MTTVLELNQKLHPLVSEDYFARKASDDKWARIWKTIAEYIQEMHLAN